MKTISVSVGIDLARRSNHMAVIATNPFAATPAPKGAFSFSHDTEGFQALKTYLCRVLGEDPLNNAAIVMEPTSGAWRDVAAFFLPLEASVFFVRTDVLSAVRKMQSRFAKTDRLDAAALATMPWTLPERLIPIQNDEGRLRTLRELSAQRFRLVEECTRWKNRLLAHLESAWRPLLITLPKSVCLSQSLLSFWDRFPHPQDLVEYGTKRFHIWFEKHAHGSLSPNVEETILNGAQKAADLRSQLGIADQERKIMRRLVPHTRKVIQFLEREIDFVEDWIEESCQEVPEREILDEIPGVGSVVSVSFATTLMPIRRFSNAKKCAAYTGFVSRKKSSAGHEIKGLRITKAGNKRLKRDLALAADFAMRHDPQLAAFAIRLLAAGKHYNQVRVAVGRKIAMRAYALLKRLDRGEKNVHYEYHDLNGQTISKQEAYALAESLWSNREEQIKKRKIVA